MLADVGRDPDAIELNTMVAKTIIGDHPEAAIAREAADAGLTVAELADSTLYLCGTSEDVCQRLGQWRDEAGISYVSLFDPGEEQITYLAERVIPALVGPGAAVAQSRRRTFSIMATGSPPTGVTLRWVTPASRMAATRSLR